MEEDDKKDGKRKSTGGKDEEESKEGANKKKKTDTDTKAAVFHDPQDEKIDVKLGTAPLVIGPIGVPPQEHKKFTLPGEWYDDDDDREGTEGGKGREEQQDTGAGKGKDKEEGRGPAPSSTLQTPAMMEQQRGGMGGLQRDSQPPHHFPGRQEPRGPPRDVRGEPLPPDFKDSQFDGPPRRGFGSDRPEFGDPGHPGFREPPRGEPGPWRDAWPGHRGERQDQYPQGGREEWERDARWRPSSPGRPDSVREGPGRVDSDSRQDPYGGSRFPPPHPQEFWDEHNPRYPSRPPRDHFPDDPMHHRQRWDYYDDRRDDPYPPRDDPYYRDYYDRYDRDRYQDPYGDRYDDRYRDPYPDPYRPRDRSPYPPPHSDDPYALYPRDRRDPYSRGPAEDSREPLPDRFDQRAVVDYGHGTPSGRGPPSRDRSPYGQRPDHPQRQMFEGPDSLTRDHHLRGGREDSRGSWGTPELQPRDRMGRERDRSPLHASPAPRQDHAPPVPSPPTLPSPQEEPEEEVGETVTIDDLVSIPGRFMRPPKIAIILRGPPGAGKTTMARMIKDREVENGGSPPRILCLDDYFMVETEKMTNDPETGRRVKTKIMEYEYEPELEESYRASLVKSFKRQVAEGFFPFIIVDCVNDRVSHFSEIATYAKKQGFEVYIGELEVDQSVCHRRNTHNHSKEHITAIIDKWERTPRNLTKVDLTPLAQDAAIEEVEMEDSMEPASTEGNQEDKNQKKNGEEEEEEEAQTEQETFLKVYNEFIRSKWDTIESQEDRMDKLDGVKAAKKKISSGARTIDDWLQLSQEYDSKVVQPGKKRVRWADIEEGKKQAAARDRGFVLGQTDWTRMTDLSFGSNALVQVRYIENRDSADK